MAAAIHEVGVLRLRDRLAIPVRIVPQHITAVTCVAHIEFETVTSLRQRIFESSQRISKEDDRQ